MEAVQVLNVVRKHALEVPQKAQSTKKTKKLGFNLESLFVRKTQSEKRKALFGKDPLI